MPAADPNTLDCPKCGAHLAVNGSSQTLTCAYCRTSVLVPQHIWRRFHPAPAHFETLKLSRGKKLTAEPREWKAAQAHEGFDREGRIVVSRERTAVRGDSYETFYFYAPDGIAQLHYNSGGGFIHAAGESQARQGADTGAAPIPFPFDTMDQLLAHGKRTGLSIPHMLRANELAHVDAAALDEGIDRIWQVMRD